MGMSAKTDPSIQVSDACVQIHVFVLAQRPKTSAYYVSLRKLPIYAS